ncbi:MAG: DNA polymerase, partial [Candidatus Thiodiazotropha taylori]|nr:DNA polymerase [Candidatus Thiodiazotropha taylori]MCW4285632.1 DNA polymerase [Candidatus Thiodiazotropha taylori]
MPVILHNMRNFDAHIICESLGKFKNAKLTCIAQTSEKYVSFSLGKLRFIDSFQFLPSSLETLVTDLAKDGLDAFPHFLTEFSCQPEAELLLRKGVYPYDYMDDESRFAEKSLPPREAFYSQIKREGISEDDYAHAQNVFEKFQLKTLGEYHDLYLKTDVLLLCDVFEAFRRVCMDQYELDPCHFYTSPGLAWIACLKMTGVSLELMTDIDQILFVESGIRGGISYIANRYARANNPLLDNYDPSEPTSYLLYLDMNNLYGFSMIQKLPTGSFRFLSEREIGQFDVLSVPEGGDKGYIVECSIKYGDHLHELHNDYPVAPEKKHVQDDELSPYAVGLWKQLHGKMDDDPLPPRVKVEKLMVTLEDKEKYVVHYRNLQLYLRLGLEIKNVHRVLEFSQEAWMKPYIDFNTEMRKKATSTFQKNFYKLMNVSVFGKTMENVRKHKNIELVHTRKRLAKLSAKPTYKTTKIFNEDLVAVEMERAKVKLYKPSYSGMCILDLSKLAMYDFYYNYLKKKYGSRVQLQMSDTDSFLLHCQVDNLYAHLKEDEELFDFSDYPESHPLFSVKNKKVLGKMKDETNGTPISEFVGLRSKMY